MPRIAISFAESVRPDLEQVQTWYREQGVPAVRARLVEEVFQRVEALADHSDMGRVVPESDQPFLRELISYRVPARYPAREDCPRLAQ